MVTWPSEPWMSVMLSASEEASRVSVASIRMSTSGKTVPVGSSKATLKMRAARAPPPAVQTAIARTAAAALDELEGAIDATGAEGYRPLMLLARAEWCQRAGDEEARRGHLREAWRLFQAMGADGALRRMKRDFGDLAS